jgi:hypothetical protein
MQGREMDGMALDVEVIYPPDDPGKLPSSWTWRATGPTVIDVLNQTWREFNVVEEDDPHGGDMNGQKHRPPISLRPEGDRP